MGMIEVARVLRRFWPLIVFSLSLGLIVALGLLWVSTPVYSSSARLFVSNQATGSADEQLQGSTYAQARVMSYADIATDPIVLDPVIKQLHLRTTAVELAKHVTATAERDRLLIEIVVDYPTSKGSAQIVNAVAKQLAQVITQVIEKPSGARDPLVSVTVVRQASAAKSPSWPVTWIFLTVGGLGGALLGLGLAFLLNATDTRVRRLDDIRRSTDTPILGTIMTDPKLRQMTVSVEMASHTVFAESIRSLRTNLQFLDAADDARRVFAVTSTVPGEGKSTIALSVAFSLAESGERVLLIDADLRNPRQAQQLDIEGSVGLTDVLRRRLSIDDAVQRVALGNQPSGAPILSVLASGAIPPNPAELLGSKRFSQLLDVLQQTYSYIIIDAPPVLAVTDAALLSRQVDGMLFIVGVERVRRPQLERALDLLNQVNAPVVGVVANRLPRTGMDARGYYYDYGNAVPRESDETLESLVAAEQGTAAPEGPVPNGLAPAKSERGSSPHDGLSGLAATGRRQRRVPSTSDEESGADEASASVLAGDSSPISAGEPRAGA